MRILIVWLLIGLVTCSGLGNISGALLYLQAPGGVVTPEVLKIQANYKKFITDDLNNSIGHEYDSIFVGLQVKFTDLNSLYRQLNRRMKVKELGAMSPQQIFTEVQKMFYDHQKKELAQAKVQLIMEPDLEVSIYDARL